MEITLTDASGNVTKNNTPSKPFPKSFVYPFFLFHMAMFGLSGFWIFYGLQDPEFGFMHGGIAMIVYLVFYLAIFWFEKVKWMILGGILGAFQIYGWLGIIATGFIGKVWPYRTFAEMPLSYHIIPGAYIVLYTFLLRNLVIDLMRARDNPDRMKIANGLFLAISGIIFVIPYFS